MEANASEKSAYDKGEKLSKARAKKGEKAREKQWSAERKSEKNTRKSTSPTAIVLAKHRAYLQRTAAETVAKATLAKSLK